MVIAHNMMAMNACRQINIVSNVKKKSTEKLSSGYRINRSADDAAGLAISEKMRRQIGGLTQASKNCYDGVSFCQVADGALNEVHDMLQRMNTLAIQSSNDTNSDQDREYLDQEVQGIKQEMKRIFNDTEYNEHKIWLAPYIPDVSRNTDPLDFATYNDTATGHTGGVSIYNVRYTWKELGIHGYISDDGNTFKQDGTISRRLNNDEILELNFKAGDSLQNISRVYRWEADDAGITINKNSSQKISWASMNLDPSNVTPGDYSFDYNGSTITFTVGDGDEMKDVLAAINGDGLNGVNWQTNSAGLLGKPAVTLNSLLRPDITASNQKYLMNPSWTMHADENGVQLTSKNYDLTSKSWSSFSDVNTGRFPIVDWGTLDEVNPSVTLDDSAMYRYQDGTTGFGFNYKLADETSLEAAINSFDGTRVSKSFYSPVEKVDSSSNIGFEINNLSFGMQNVLGRDMYKADSFSASMNITTDSSKVNTVELNIKGHDTDYSSGQTAVYQTSFTDDYLNDCIRRSGKTSFTFTLANEQELKDTISPEELSEGLKSISRNLTVTMDFSNITTLGQAKTALTNTMTIEAKKATMNMNYYVNAETSYENIENMKVNPPMKKLDIQAGSERDQFIRLTWSPLNLSILSMNSTNVLSTGTAGAAINTIKDALHTISDQRSYFGAQQNRLEHTIRNLDNVVENTTAAESRIRDTDMAKEMVEFSKQNILEQVGQSMLAQANQSNQGVLSLLQ